jgi:hypothetical protein
LRYHLAPQPPLTAETGSGSTIRIDWKKAKPKQCAMYFNCQYEGNRAIIFDEDDAIPAQAFKLCIAASLTYHRRTKNTTRVLHA